MLPVANMVSDVERATVKGVEVEVEDVDAVIRFMVDDDGGVDARGCAVAVWCCAAEPCWVGGHVVFGCQVDICTEAVEIGYCDGARSAGYWGVVDFWCCVGQEGVEVGWEVGFLAV